MSHGDSTPPSLDFFSPDFDPLEALQSDELQPPNPSVRPLDNLNKCRHILPQEIPESIANITHKSRTPESIEAQKRAKARSSLRLEKAAEKARETRIFDVLAEKAKGPLRMLYTCYNEKGQVQVWTRHTHGVRGSLIGFLKAFDRHMNMILQDVEEKYTVRQYIPRLVRKRGRCKKDSVDESQPGSSSKDISNMSEVTEGSVKADDDVDSLTEEMKELRLFPKLEHRRRHLGQVFLRGDNVVMIRRVHSTELEALHANIAFQ